MKSKVMKLPKEKELENPKEPSKVNKDSMEG